MFEKLIHLIDRWNQMVDDCDSIRLIYDRMNDYLVVIRYSSPRKNRIVLSDNIQDAYLRMKELYTDRFVDPAVEPEKFNITTRREDCDDEIMNPNALRRQMIRKLHYYLCDLDGQYAYLKGKDVLLYKPDSYYTNVALRCGLDIIKKGKFSIFDDAEPEKYNCFYDKCYKVYKFESIYGESNV